LRELFGGCDQLGDEIGACALSIRRARLSNGQCHRHHGVPLFHIASPATLPLIANADAGQMFPMAIAGNRRMAVALGDTGFIAGRNDVIFRLR
jgi:hypothetical protein